MILTQHTKLQIYEDNLLRLLLLLVIELILRFIVSLYKLNEYFLQKYFQITR